MAGGHLIFVPFVHMHIVSVVLVLDAAVGGSFLTDLQEHRASATPTSLWHEIVEAMFNNSASLAFIRPKPSPNGSETMHIGSH